MMSSIAAYNEYAQNVLMASMVQNALAQIKVFKASGDTDNPHDGELRMQQHYLHHVPRLAAEPWLEPVVRSFSRINKKIYVPLQGPSELGASGLLLDGDRTGDLHHIAVPALVIGAQHDRMDAAY